VTGWSIRSGRSDCNAHHERRVSMPTSVVTMVTLATRAACCSGVVITYAGSTAEKSTPNGLGAIMRESEGTILGVTGGLTLIKSAAAFQAPSFVTTTTSVRNGNQVQHFAEIRPSVSADATHDSYYLGPGDHLRPGSEQKIGGKNYTHYLRISPGVSELIRQGEQEHLDDAMRAYNLTYKLIADEINAMVGQRFGPAQTPDKATQLAEAALAKRLPSELGVEPSNWVAVLDRLLLMTKTRDKNGWHSLITDPPKTSRNTIIHVVSTGPKFQVGHVSSTEVVNY